jgi:small subunit ribosomal protein S1
VDHVDSDARRLSLHYVDAKELEARGWVLGADTKGALRILGRMEVAAGQLVNPEPAGAPSERAPRQRAPQGNIGDIYDVTVDKVETFGVFVSWATGRGLVPGSELGVPRNADLKRSFPVGTQFKASVVDIRSDGKLKLSKTAVEHAEERAEMEAYQRSTAPASGKGFGTLGDLLKARSGK